MTRENKLALVIGFALILFVGVLVSDHFSAARTLQEADLGLERGPIIAASQPAVRIIDLNQQQHQAAAAEPTASADAPLESGIAALDESPVPPGFAEVSDFIAPDLQARADAASASEAAGAAQAGFVVHDVLAGETLMAISRKYFGDGSHVRQLAEFNDLSDPNMLRPGARLRVPVAQAEPASSSADASAFEAPGTYTIKSTDTLSEISRRLLGTSKRWREIVALNPDVIDDPDHITPGAVIKVPSTKRAIRLASDRL